MTSIRVVESRDQYRCTGEEGAGLHPPGDLRFTLPLFSETEELEAAIDCLFSGQQSSILSSSIFCSPWLPITINQSIQSPKFNINSASS